MSTWIKQNKNFLLILVGLVLIVYFNSLGNAFLSDDLAEIVNNPNIGNLGYAISTHPTGFIRPVLYALVFNIAGLNNILFRLINIFFHLGSTILIFAILSKIYSKRLAIFVSSIFAIHPGIGEAVVWISGGGYPQYSFFFLLSFLTYLLSANKPKLYIISLLSFLLAFMSHPQMPLALFIIFPLWEILFGNFKKSWKRTIPYLIITLAFVGFVLADLPERENTLKTVNYQESGTDNIFVLIPTAISSYFELIFFPATLTLYHSELNFGVINFSIRALLTILYFGTLIYCFWKNKKVFFWGAFFLIALAPTLTPFRLNWIVAERYLYLPIVGILTILGFGFEKITQNLKYLQISFAFIGVILIILGTRTFLRNIDWHNEDNLWIATGKTSPSSPNTHNNLGDVYGRWGDKQRSLQEFLTAIALKPNYADAYHNAGNVYRELGQYDKALEFYQKAADLSPILWQSYQNMAAIYFQEKKYDKALEAIQKAIQINPKNANLYDNLGVVYLAMGNKQKAKEVFSFVLQNAPGDQFAQQGLAEASK